MKVLIGAVAAAMLFCGSAAAQTETPATPQTPPAQVQVPPSRCGDFPAAPTPPDGATAGVPDMERALEGFRTWDAAYRQVLACRRTEHAEINAAAVARKDEHDNGARNLNTTTDAWSTEVNEFNGRQRPRARGRQ